MSVTTFRFPVPDGLPVAGPEGGVPRVTLSELIAVLAPCTDGPHETLAAAVHLVVTEQVYLVGEEPSVGHGSPGQVGDLGTVGDGSPDARRRVGRVLAPLLQVMLAFGFLFVVYLAVAAHAAESGSAAPPVPDARGSCIDNALGQRFCAPEPSGSAVRDALGKPLCAPGECVRVDGEWHCSTVPGGSAGVTREQTPECDGGCAAPEPTYCEEL